MLPNAAPTEPAADSPEAVEQVKPQAEKEGIEKTKEPEKTQETERTESPAEEVLGGQDRDGHCRLRTTCR